MGNLAGEVIKPTKCGFCEKRDAEFEVVMHDVGIDRPVNIVRCKSCKAAIGVIELCIPDEVAREIRKEQKERE